MYEKNIQAILDVLFPPVCASCRAHGSWWCSVCRGAMEKAELRDVPPVSNLDAVCVVGFYHDPCLRKAVHVLKYRGASVLLPDITQAVRVWQAGKSLPWDSEQELAVQPLIGAPRRVRERGFDQARLLAGSLAPLLAPSAFFADLLNRRDTDAAQASLEGSELRAANIAGMFMPKDAPMPKGVLLVDDVMTTGSTMSEAARVLRAAGVRHVYGFALALGK